MSNTSGNFPYSSFNSVQDQARLELDSIERSDELSRALLHLKDRMHTQHLSPLATESDLVELALEFPVLAPLFDAVLRLSDGCKLNEVPPADEFVRIDSPYIGADGIARYPSPKYIPKHMARDLQKMQAGYLRWLERIPKLVGPNGRPGLIVRSGYHSPHYQVAVLAKEIIESGLTSTLQRIALAHESDHTDFHNPAIDFVTIGDINGRNVYSNPDPEESYRFGTPIPFGDTIEFTWLLRRANEYAFYVPYSPREDSPASAESIVQGMVVQEAHLRYIGNSDAAQDMMTARRAFGSFERRATMLDHQARFQAVA